jgi:hypothetical protein
VLTMELKVGQLIHLMDSSGRQIGQVVIERSEGDLVTGEFSPGPAFTEVQGLFQAFEEAADLQALSAVDELDTQIGSLGLHARDPDDSQCIGVHDLQIWSDGGVSFRLGTPSSADDREEAAQPPPTTGAMT